MIQWSTDNEDHIRTESLSIYQIISIGKDSAITLHNAFLLSGRACCEEYVGNVFYVVRILLQDGGAIFTLKRVESFRREVLLQRYGNGSNKMRGKVFNYKACILLGTEEVQHTGA